MSILHPEIMTTPDDRWAMVRWFIVIAGVVGVIVLLGFPSKARASIGDNADRSFHAERHVTHQRAVKPTVRKTRKVAQVRRRVDKSAHTVAAKKSTSAEVVGADTSLVAKARSYLGTNPTGRRSLWCAAFMALIAPRAARRVKNPNMARDWAALPHVEAQVGAIVVLTRPGGGPGGGHVGVVSGFDGHGNPKVVSGNHNHVVGEGVYPKGRVIAYVAPLDQVAMAVR